MANYYLSAKIKGQENFRPFDIEKNKTVKSIVYATFIVGDLIENFNQKIEIFNKTNPNVELKLNKL